jgi:hypothetical protein
MSCVTQLIQGPEGVIPSLVRLEYSKERDNFLGDIAANAASIYEIVQFGEAVADRELRSLGGDFSRRDSGGVSGLIEDGSESLKGLLSNLRAGIGQPLGELEFELLLGRIVRIDLTPQFVWLFLLKDPNLAIKFGDVFAASREPSPSAGEGIAAGDGHVRQPGPDERP